MDASSEEGRPVAARAERRLAPTGWNLVALVVALCFLAGAIGWRVAQPTNPSRTSAEVGFLYDMIDHHQQAIAISAIESERGRNPAIRAFAGEIQRFQSYEIGLMERLLAERGYSRNGAPDRAMTWMGESVRRDAMPGLASAAEMDGLRRAGNDVDAWFVALIVDHHAGGAAMAERADELISDRSVSELAARMARVQRQEITEILDAATREGIGPLPPAGVTWDVYGADGMDMAAQQD